MAGTGNAGAAGGKGPPASEQADRRRAPRSRAERVRLGLAGLLGALVTAFALLNTDSVQVDWIFGTLSTPLIVVILVSVGVGLILGVLLARRMSGSAR